MTLSLDKNGHNAGGDKAVSGAAPQAGRSAADAILAGDMLEEAYALSLGNEENAPVAAEIAREMSRVKEYEILGLTAGHRSRKNPGTGNNEPALPQPGGIQQSMNDSVKTPNAAVMKQITDMSDNARTAFLTDEEMTRLAATVLVSGRSRGASQAIALSGSMDNLGKVHELPYSLYIFGNMSAGRRGDTDEDIEIDASKDTSAERKQAGKFLRRSEAVKMAAVLQHLYYGGNGWPDSRLIWSEFFDTRDVSRGREKYPLEKLTAMSKEAYKAVINEYFAQCIMNYIKKAMRSCCRVLMIRRFCRSSVCPTMPAYRTSNANSGSWRRNTIQIRAATLRSSLN